MNLKETDCAFTVEYCDYASSLNTYAKVFSSRRKGEHPAEDEIQNSPELNAIWDTGATSTCISNKVAASLGLVPDGKERIGTAGGSVIVSTYIIDVLFPGHVFKQHIEAAACDMDIDVLIGMDIISCGDFSVTNAGLGTLFSFRIPSRESIDYVANEFS